MVLFEAEKYGFIESNFVLLKIILEFSGTMDSEYVWGPKEYIKIIKIVKIME